MANFLFRARVSRTSWNPSRTCRLRAGICRNRSRLGKVESCAAHRPLPVRLVEFRRLVEYRAGSSVPRAGKPSLTVFCCNRAPFIQNLCLQPKHRHLLDRNCRPCNLKAPTRRSSNRSSSAICSIPGCGYMPASRRSRALSEYQPARIEDELPDLVFYTVDTGAQPPRLIDRQRRHADVERLREYRQGPLSRRVSWREARSDRDAGLLRMHRPPPSRLHHRQYR